MSFRIQYITAFTAVGEDDEEGVTAFWSPLGNTWMPMVAADMKRNSDLRPMADQMRAAGTDITERRFVPIELADELAGVLSRVVVGWEERLGVDLATYQPVVDVMAKYRALKEVVDEHA